MNIKVLFVFTLLSLAVVIVVAAIVGVRIWWQMKTRRARPEGKMEGAEGEQRERLP